MIIEKLRIKEDPTCEAIWSRQVDSLYPNPSPVQKSHLYSQMAVLGVKQVRSTLTILNAAGGVIAHDAHTLKSYFRVRVTAKPHLHPTRITRELPAPFQSHVMQCEGIRCLSYK